MAEWKDTKGTKWRDTKGTKWKDRIEINVAEEVKVREALGGKVTEEQDKFLERVRKALLEFRLEEVDVSFPLPRVTFRFVRKGK